MHDLGAFRVVGKLVWSGLDCEGNLHIVLRNSDRFWGEAAVQFLRQMEGRVLKLDVDEWRRRSKTFECLKRSREP